MGDDEGCVGAGGEVHDERGVAVTTGNLGHLSLLQGNHKSAAAFSIESLELHRKIRDKEGMATSLTNLGLGGCGRS
ncbi:MAG: tetratricopeptide repeat protein [Actinobacteria bacterium]|nr:tetratricopeptide repeat protein [Actinomycetota bacterium]